MLFKNKIAFLTIFCFAVAVIGCKSKSSMAKKVLVAPIVSVKLDTVIKTVVVHDTIPKLSLGEHKVWTLEKAGLHNDVRQETAIHYDIRKPNYVIIHHTAQNSLNQTIRTFQVEHTKVSAHYVISRDGVIVQMLNDYVRGWHAGLSKWGSITDMNSISIGIELDNNGKEAFPDAQIEALIQVLDTLKSNYGIPSSNFIGHADIAPARKNDPSVYFPWKRLADRGFGLWYNPSELVSAPDNFNPIDALKIIGYDTRNLKAAIVAFKRKFIVNDVSPELSVYDKSVLYNLYQKY
ncbi:N-acetylmuramoyl-L-alanine amidase [Sphingobacterium sp. SG20118]|uniref:N-acetylmuramoyl-L-alanine amidase n=1 Tax=Sphingobacterium sp. SG20118 TaxID=3367156 RepID=UPI0037DFC84A